MNVLAITGSLRKGSFNTALLRSLQGLGPEGMTIDIADLHGIPLYDGDVEAASGKPESVMALEARARSAQGVIIGSPEYNYSIPGVLKNGLDWLSRPQNAFKDKR